MPHTSHTVLQSTTNTCGAISLVATTYAIIDIAIKSRGQQLSFTQEALVVLLIFNFGVAFGGVFGVFDDGTPSFCTFQGFMIQFNSFGVVLWVMKIVWDMYKWIVKKKRLDALKSRFKRDVIGIFILAFVPSIVLVGMNFYSQSGPWCWISVDKPAARYACFYAPLWSLISIALLWCRTSNTIWSVRSKGHG